MHTYIVYESPDAVQELAFCFAVALPDLFPSVADVDQLIVAEREDVPLSELHVTLPLELTLQLSLLSEYVIVAFSLASSLFVCPDCVNFAEPEFEFESPFCLAVAVVDKPEFEPFAVTVALRTFVDVDPDNVIVHSRSDELVTVRVR